MLMLAFDSVRRCTPSESRDHREKKKKAQFNFDVEFELLGGLGLLSFGQSETCRGVTILKFRHSCLSSFHR